MFPTLKLNQLLEEARKNVAIPSNQVNVSYEVEISNINESEESQSPRIGSMFLTKKVVDIDIEKMKLKSQSPRIGSMFLT